MNVIYKDETEAPIKCQRLSSDTETDWCMADAARSSLREHMKLLKDAYAEIERLKELQINEIVIGDRLVDANGSAQGTVLTSSHWDKRIADTGLSGRWCQIIIRPVEVNP